MKFSREEDLGILILAYIARNSNNFISAKDISLGINISLPFTKKIVYKLRNSGILKSKEGKLGGFMLNKDPSDISLKDVIEGISGNINQTECFSKSCPIEDKCLSKIVLNKVNRDFVNNLSKIKISSMV